MKHLIRILYGSIGMAIAIGMIFLVSFTPHSRTIMILSIPTIIFLVIAYGLGMDFEQYLQNRKDNKRGGRI